MAAKAPPPLRMTILVFGRRAGGIALGWALAVDAEAILPAIVGLDILEAQIWGVTHLSAADAGEASFSELLGHAFVVPHPEMARASEDSGGNRPQPSWQRGFAEKAFLHETGAGCGSGIAGIEADELFEVGYYEAKSPAGTKIGEDVSDGEAELVEGHVLEDMGAVDGLRRLWRDGEAFDHVAILNVFGIGREAFFHKQRCEKREAALQPEGGTSVEV